MNRPKIILAALFGSLLLSTQVRALDFDFSGTFRQDNQVDSLFFTVGSASTITIFSSSWDDGGFDPILAIWDSAGNRLAEQDDGHNIGSTLSNATLYSHGDWDSYYNVNLAAGTYRATIAQYANFSNGTTLGAGFAYDGFPHFTNTFGYGPQPDFNGVLSSNDARTGNYVFHVLNVEQAHQVPGVPDGGSTAALMGLALVGMAVVRRRLK